MTLTSHFFVWMEHWRGIVTGSVLLLAAVLMLTLPMPGRGPDLYTPDAFVQPVVSALDLALLRTHAAVFGGGGSPAPAGHQGVWEDFRFAGTFFLYSADPQEPAAVRRAVVAYRPETRQYIVSEGDLVGGAQVIRIDSRELVLRIGTQEAALPLGVARDAAEGVAPAGTGAGEGTTQPDGAGSRFGRLTAAGTWVMNREALLAYYEELLDEPERLLQVFDSMAPMYTADGQIEGYQVRPVGEADFFAAVGFKEGDAVRAVNTLPMTNRRRAEFFIRQVVENDLTAIVIDVERDGTPQRLVYELE
jgi:hypothetical protein